MLVFVYGTLLRGLERHPALRGSRWLGPAIIEARLYDLGSYPGIGYGAGAVIGELYDIDAATLARLDAIEGYEEGREDHALFVRRIVQARRFSDGATVTASCYCFNGELANMPHIGHGDYRRYRLENGSSERWVLAYASNISIDRLAKRVGAVSAYKTGHIRHYELVCNKRAWDRPTAYANLAVAENSACPAVAYHLSLEQIEILDRLEGAPNHYVRTTTCFTADVDGEMVCQVYLAHPNKLVAPQIPKSDYLAHIRRGYQEHGFDLSLLAKLQ